MISRLNDFTVVKSEIEVGNVIQSNWSNRAKDLTISNKVFEVKKYHPLLNLLNFHSWAPFSLNPDESQANLGASIFSQNLAHRKQQKHLLGKNVRKEAV